MTQQRQFQNRKWAKEHLYCGPAHRTDEDENRQWPTKQSWREAVATTRDSPTLQDQLTELRHAVEILTNKLARAERKIADLQPPDLTTQVEAAEAALVDYLREHVEIDAIRFSIEREIPYPIVEQAIEKLVQKGWLSPHEADDEGDNNTPD